MVYPMAQISRSKALGMGSYLKPVAGRSILHPDRGPFAITQPQANDTRYLRFTTIRALRGYRARFTMRTSCRTSARLVTTVVSRS